MIFISLVTRSHRYPFAISPVLIYLVLDDCPLFQDDLDKLSKELGIVVSQTPLLVPH